MGQVYKVIYTAVEKKWNCLWKSEVLDEANRFRGQKNRGLVQPPNPGNTMDGTV
jgi:hypothetical protein